MSPYTFVLFVHVLAAVVLVGNSVLTPVIRNLLCEATTVDRLTRADGSTAGCRLLRRRLSCCLLLRT